MGIRNFFFIREDDTINEKLLHTGYIMSPWDSGRREDSLRILVTGGAGFIGANFLFYMRKKYPDYRLICLDNLTYAGNLSTLTPFSDDVNFRFIQGNICDRERVYALFEEEKPDMVVNFAAESHVDRSIEDPAVFLMTNIIGTSVLMDACRKYGIQRFHQISTDEVYGDLPLCRKDLSFTENTPLHANSPYSSSKAGADLLAGAYYRTYDLPVTISRCSNNYGPWQYPEKLIPFMILQILQGKDLPLYGDGKNVRDWIHVEDHCRAIDLIIHKGRNGEIYNIGGQAELSNIDLVRMICREMNYSESHIIFVADRRGHDRRYSMNSSRISSELHWKPSIPFHEGLKETIRWYVEHRDWWKELSFPEI